MTLRRNSPWQEPRAVPSQHERLLGAVLGAIPSAEVYRIPAEPGLSFRLLLVLHAMGAAEMHRRLVNRGLGVQTVTELDQRHLLSPMVADRIHENH